jgi:tRNA nucleotidyltransferase (CCA-adding enzyme)
MDKKIYLVGGAVRDRLLGLEVQDKDYVAVGYEPSDFSHLEQVGKDFPVFLQEDGSELALARLERKTGVGYNGFEAEISNVSLEEDLKRRDLTINSIAYDERADRYIDFYNGKEDLEKKLLRHTSEAFVEDPLRVLRLARFRARFGQEWSIDNSTKELVKSMKQELKYLQSDRVYKEIEKVMEGKNSYIFFETLLELDVLDILFPSIYNLTKCHENSKYHIEDSVFVHTMMVMCELDNQSKLLKLTALYHDIAKPQCYEKYAKGIGHDRISFVEPLIDIKLPKKLQKRMLFLIQKHIKIMLIDKMKPATLATFFEKFKKDKALLEELLIFREADSNGRITEIQKEVLDEKKIFKTFDAICSYSPKEWIESQEQKPSNNSIIQHIHKQNISLVKRYFMENE